MSLIGQLYSGNQLVRLIPLQTAMHEFRTPRMLPPRLAEMDPFPAPSSVEIDSWQWTGESADGTVTADFWIRTFGTDLPADTDRSTFEVPVEWLRYRWVVPA